MNSGEYQQKKEFMLSSIPDGYELYLRDSNFKSCIDSMVRNDTNPIELLATLCKMNSELINKNIELAKMQPPPIFIENNTGNIQM